MIMAFLRGLEKAPTFLVPIINPPFADNSPHFSSPAPGAWYIKYLVLKKGEKQTPAAAADTSCPA
jgi:hypothetical protein